MHADPSTIATPETLDQIADAHAGAGDELTAKTFRAMVASWRSTERALDQAQAENSRLAQTLSAAHSRASELEALAASTANVLASIGPPVRPANEATTEAAA